jgi:hypothetical protein
LRATQGGKLPNNQGEESSLIIKVVDQPTTGENNSFSTLTCKIPTMLEESIMTKVKDLELEFIHQNF